MIDSESSESWEGSEASLIDKIVVSKEAEGVEQLQSTALDSEETTTTGTCTKGIHACNDYTHIINIIMMMFASQKL